MIQIKYLPVARWFSKGNDIVTLHMNAGPVWCLALAESKASSIQLHNQIVVSYKYAMVKVKHFPDALEADPMVKGGSKAPVCQSLDEKAQGHLDRGNSYLKPRITIWKPK